MSNISFDMKANDENVQKTLVKQQAEIAKLLAQQAAMEQQTKKNADAARDFGKSADEVSKRLAKLTEGTKAQAEAAKEAAKAEKLAAEGASEALRKHNAVMAEGKRVTDSVATSSERREAQLEKLNKLHREGAINTETYNRAIARESAGLAQGRTHAASFTASMAGVASTMAASAAATFSMSEAIQFLKSEYDAMLERQNKSRDANITLAGAQEGLLDNLGGENAAGVFGRLRELSKGKGIDETKLTQALSETLGARADMSMASVFGAVESAAKLKTVDTSKIPVIASATLDVQKQTGMGTDEALGFLGQMQAQSRVKNMASLAENLTPGIGGVMNFGADRQTAAAILTSLSHGLGDTTGATSKTAGINLAKQLREFGGAGSNIAETIATIQSDEGVRANFFGKRDEGGFGATFEAAALPAVESLLSGGTQARQFANARAAFAQDPRAALQAQIDARAAAPAIRIAETDLVMANATNQMQVGDTAGATSSVARNRLKEIQEQSGRWSSTLGFMWAPREVEQMAIDAMNGGQMTPKLAIDQLRGESDALKRGRTDWTRFAWPNSPGLASVIESQNRRNPETAEQVKKMDAMIDVLERQLALMEKDQAAAAGRMNLGAAVGRANLQKEQVAP